LNFEERKPKGQSWPQKRKLLSLVNRGGRGTGKSQKTREEV